MEIVFMAQSDKYGGIYKQFNKQRKYNTFLKNQYIHWKCRLLLENKLCAALKLLIYVNIDVVSSMRVIVFKLSKHLIVGVNISASMYLMICPSYDGLFFLNRMLHNFPARPPTCISMPYLSLYKIYSDHENVAGNNAGN